MNSPKAGTLKEIVLGKLLKIRRLELEVAYMIESHLNSKPLTQTMNQIKSSNQSHLEAGLLGVDGELIAPSESVKSGFDINEFMKKPNLDIVYQKIQMAERQLGFRVTTKSLRRFNKDKATPKKKVSRQARRAR